MPKFNIGEIVRTVGGKNEDRVEGVVKHFTCDAATKSGGGTCDRKTCSHKPKNRYWVKWPNDFLASYKVSELEIDNDAEENTLEELAGVLGDEQEGGDLEAAKVIHKIMRNRKARKNQGEAEDTNENKVEEKVMSKPESGFAAMIKSDATKAAYRVAAKQINTGVRSAMVEVLKKKGVDNSHIEGITMFLESEFGAALVSTATGYGLAHAPMINKDPRAQKLATEFRINGMATAGNAVIEALLGELIPVITTALKSLPSVDEEQVATIETSSPARLESRTNENEEVEIEIEEDLSLLETSMEEQAKRVSNGH